MWSQHLLALLLFLAFAVSGAAPMVAQPDSYDPSWYDGAQPHIRIGVVQDGVYAVPGSDLARAGVPLATVDASTLRLLANGREVPLHVAAGADGRLNTTERLYFVGRRNRGDDEAWAYQYDPTLQSSTHYSLFSDTTYYWLTWGETDGLRYAPGASDGGPAVREVRDTVRLEQDERYFYGGSLAGHPLYTRGEGYYWHAYRGERSNTYAVPLPAQADGPLHVRVHALGESGSCHRLVLDVDLDGTGTFAPVDTADWEGYSFADLAVTVAEDARTAHRETLRLRVRSLSTFDDSQVFTSPSNRANCEQQIASGAPNYVLLDWIEADYSRTLDAAAGIQQDVFLEATGPSTLQLTGFDATPLHAYDPANRHRYEIPVGTASQLPIHRSLPGPLWLTSADGYLSPASLHSDRPSTWSSPANRADYVILTTRALQTSAEQLAAYRQSPEGGDHATAVVDVQDVFDEFDYGRPTPLAIRRFVSATRGWERPPEMLVIWADAPYPVRTERDHSTRPAWAVPSFGYAPSDGWFAMQHDGLDDWTESVAVGRIPVRTNAEGAAFIDKLRQYERGEPAPWTKRMLALAGGTAAGEQASLQRATTRWATAAASPPVGMDTLFFFKKSGDALDATFQDSLRVALRRGASWLNYFGHAAAGSWEIVTDDPRAFDNAGTLPVVVSLGCRTGSFAGGRFEVKDTPSFGEQLLMGSSSDDPTPSLNGAIAHFGASDSGTIPSSSQLNDHLIDAVFRDSVTVLGRAVRRAKNAFARARGNVKHSLQYGLLGDPATQLAIPQLPDPVVAPEDLSVTPLTPIAADSQLTARVRLRNQGLVPADSVAVRVEHVAPGGATVHYEQRIAPFALEETVTVAMPIDDAHVGENRVVVRFDPDGQLDEASELNNTAEQRHTVFATDLALVYPRANGLVDVDRPRLRAALATAQDAGLPVLFELDTTRTFTSPARQQGRVEATPLYAEWQPPQPLEDGHSYFWRVRPEAASAAAAWQHGSFTVRIGAEDGGWLQQGPLFAGVETSPSLQRAAHHWQLSNYHAEVNVTSERGSGNDKGNIYLNGVRLPGLHLGFGFGVVVMDAATGEVHFSGSMCTYDAADRYEEVACYNDVDEGAAVAVLDSVLTAMEHGDHLFVRTRNLAIAGSREITEQVKALFRPLLPQPASIDTMGYDHLWTLHARKGLPDAAVQEVAAPGGTNEITMLRRLPFQFAAGTATSEPIGPAAAWGSLSWAASLPNASSTVRVEVLDAASDSVLLRGTPNGTTDLAMLDPARHPLLRLRATLSDSSQRATPQLLRWHIGFEGLPDLALDPSTLVVSADTLQEGQPLEVSVTARNLSHELATDAVLEVTHTDAQNRTRTVYADTLTLAADSTRPFTLPVETVGYAGSNRLQMRISQPDHVDGTSYNNVLMHPFYVRTDDVPPVCRVRVDGRALPHDPAPVANLQSRELPFVSARPSIEIEVEDENPYRALEDSSVVELRFGSSLNHLDALPVVPLDHPSVEFIRGETAGDPARVIFTPDLSGGDSTYTLAVTVRDASGNASTPESGSSYQVHFRVQQHVRVENLYPYPNPMSTFTRFAFRLEGADPSTIEDFRLRIYTLSGLLVREFDLAPPAAPPQLNDGGGLRIDWNTLLWDTRDADGDLVAPGVYLYRVFLRTTDEDVEVNEDARVEKLVVVR